MRAFAAIFPVLLGISIARAEGDPREPYGPQAATVETKAKTRQAAPKVKTKPARTAGPAANPEARRAEPPKSKPDAAKPKREAARPRPGAKPAASIEKPDRKTTAQPAKAQPKGASPTPDAASAAPARIDQGLRDSYAAIPLAEHLALQSDLIWTGDYNGLINGEFSERVVEAVKSYQKRQKGKTTGVLNPQERAALRAAAQPRQHEVGWRLTEDPATGGRIGLPLKLATKREPAPTGTRWSSQQGQLQIETFRIDTGATLEAVFEQQKKDPPQRRVSYNALRLEHFVVSGTQGLKKFYVRGFAQNGEVRGITILYDQAMEGIMDSVVVAMSSAFAPFTSYATAGAPDAPPRKRIDYATGLVVSAIGHIVTARQAVEGCQAIVVPQLGNAERVAEQVDGELALIRIYGARKLAPIGMGSAGSPPGAVMLVGIADPQAQGGGAAVTTVPAKIGSGTANLLPLDSSPATGFSGGAALDGNGELLGVIALKPAIVAGVSNVPKAAIVPVAAIRNFLEANHVEPASGTPGVEHAKASMVRVICVRK